MFTKILLVVSLVVDLCDRDVTRKAVKTIACVVRTGRKCKPKPPVKTQDDGAQGDERAESEI